MDILYGTHSIIKPYAPHPSQPPISPTLPPDSVRLLERCLTFYWHFNIFLNMSSLSPVVPCIDYSPYSNIYGDSVVCFGLKRSICIFFFFHSIAFLNSRENQRITQWTYLFSYSLLLLVSEQWWERIKWLQHFTCTHTQLDVAVSLYGHVLKKKKTTTTTVWQVHIQ